VRLAATDGGAIGLAEAAAGTLVLYVYPRTGDPGEPVPADWDAIPGARGCTPQNCAFRDHQAELAGLGATVHGLSAQPLEEQRAFAEHEHMPFPLLNDEERVLERALGLPTFEYRGARYYRRITLVVRGGRIEKVFYPVAPTADHVEEVLRWLREQAV
jgi:peroxiredoxin